MQWKLVPKSPLRGDELPICSSHEWEINLYHVWDIICLGLFIIATSIILIHSDSVSVPYPKGGIDDWVYLTDRLWIWLSHTDQ